MENGIFRISLDVHRQTTQAHLAVKQGDTARSIVVTLVDGCEPYAVGEGSYAVFMGKKPDGTVLYNDCVLENGCITYEFTEQTACCAGYMPCEIRLYGGDGGLITSPRFAIVVSGTVYPDGTVVSASEFTTLSNLIEQANALIRKVTTVTGEVYFNGEYHFLQDCTFGELLAAYKGGACVLLHFSNTYAEFSSLYVLSYVPKEENFLVFRGEQGHTAAELTVYEDDTVTFSNVKSVPVARTVNGKALSQNITLTAEDVGVPAALPNPNKLIISGAVSAEYDGSAPVSVSIPHSSVDPEAVDSAVTEYLRANPVKTAYEYAVDGGYPGTEAEFARELSTMGAGQAVQEAELTEVWAAIAALRNGETATYPVIDVPSGWYIAGESGANMAKSAITKITICDSYDTTDKAIDKSYYIGSLGEDIMFHRIGTEMIIAGNGSGKIKLGENAQAMFNNFTALEEIVGLELLDVSDVTALNGFFVACPSLKTVDISGWNCVRVTQIQRMFYGCTALESVKMPRYGLPAVSNSKEVFEGCYALKSVDMGRSLPVVGEKAFYKCHSLENLTGLNRVTTIGDYAFIYTPSLHSDLEPERITAIGEQALRLSGVEDTADMSGVARVGTDATRLARWSQEELDEIRAVKLPTVHFSVPNSACQYNYADAKTYPFATVDEDGDGVYETALSVSESGCPSLALYHIWQATYAGTDKEYAGYEAWFKAVNGSFAEFAETNHMSGNPASILLTNMGWERVITDVSVFAKGSENKAIVANELRSGRPVLVCMHSTNTLDNLMILHAVAIIGSDEASDKLWVIDSSVYGTTGVESLVAFEDLFTGADGNGITYVRTTLLDEAVEGTAEDGVFTRDGLQVYSYAKTDGETAYYAVLDGVYYHVSKCNADWIWTIKPKE